MHDFGFLHLDLKPLNIMITSNGILKVIDLEGAIQIRDKSSLYKVTFVRFTEAFAPFELSKHNSPPYSMNKIKQNKSNKSKQNKNQTKLVVGTSSDVYGVGYMIQLLILARFYPTDYLASLDEVCVLQLERKYQTEQAKLYALFGIAKQMTRQNMENRIKLPEAISKLEEFHKE